MTISQLIEKLERIKDKSIPVGSYHPSCQDGPSFFNEYKNIEIMFEPLYNEKTNKEDIKLRYLRIF